MTQAALPLRRTINIQAQADYVGVMYQREGRSSVYSPIYRLFENNDPQELAAMVSRCNAAQAKWREYLCVMRRNGDPYNVTIREITWREDHGER